jgi:hypothetical protein
MTKFLNALSFQVRHEPTQIAQQGAPLHLPHSQRLDLEGYMFLQSFALAYSGEV